MRKARLLRLRIAMGVLVALVGMLSFADFLSHTDDGCAVEVHCLACRAHLTTVTDLVALASHSPGVPEVVAIEWTEDLRPVDEGLRLLPPGRAPPVTA